METIDTRGLSCPQPVIMTTQAVRNALKEFEVLVDSEASFENVSRFLQSRSYGIAVEDRIDHKVIRAVKHS
jgi:tRNA 2-thiouridine synthesizing protein A